VDAPSQEMSFNVTVVPSANNVIFCPVIVDNVQPPIRDFPAAFHEGHTVIVLERNPRSCTEFTPVAQSWFYLIHHVTPTR